MSRTTACRGSRRVEDRGVSRIAACRGPRHVEDRGVSRTAACRGSRRVEDRGMSRTTAHRGSRHIEDHGMSRTTARSAVLHFCYLGAAGGIPPAFLPVGAAPLAASAPSCALTADLPGGMSGILSFGGSYSLVHPHKQNEVRTKRQINLRITIQSS